MRVALVDCNSFYASCETVFRPDLREKPVVVLSNNDGCVVALNQRAKDLGIERTTPIFQLKQLVDQYRVEVFSSNYTLYGDLSHRVKSIYRLFTPLIEDYSIDESFLWFPDQGKIPSSDIRTTVKQWTGIPVSVGIGPTKTLAKCANKLAKKNPEGWFEISAGNRVEVLKDFPIGQVWGIGRATSSALESWGVQTAFGFTQLDPFRVKQRFTIQGWRLQRELLGEPQIDLEVPEPKQNIVSSRSFSHPVTEYVDMEEAVAEYAAGAAEKLRGQRSVCCLVCVYVTTNFFRLDEPQYSQSVCVRLPHPTAYTPDLVGASLRGLQDIFKPGFKYKKAGVMLLGLEPSRGLQGNLFLGEDPKLLSLQEAIDGLNRRYGRDVVRCYPRRAGADWMMNRQSLSPRYTTQWKDVPKVG